MVPLSSVFGLRGSIKPEIQSNRGRSCEVFPSPTQTFQGLSYEDFTKNGNFWLAQIFNIECVLKVARSLSRGCTAAAGLDRSGAVRFLSAAVLGALALRRKRIKEWVSTFLLSSAHDWYHFRFLDDRFSDTP